jgi:hypothetical protein
VPDPVQHRIDFEEFGFVQRALAEIGADRR